MGLEQARRELARYDDPDRRRRRKHLFYGVTVPVLRAVSYAILCVFSIAQHHWSPVLTDRAFYIGLAIFLCLTVGISTFQNRLSAAGSRWAREVFGLLDFPCYVCIIILTGGVSSPYFWLAGARVADQPGIDLRTNLANACGAVLSTMVGFAGVDGLGVLLSFDAIIRVLIVVNTSAYFLLTGRIAYRLRKGRERMVHVARELVEELDAKNRELAELAQRAEQLAEAKGNFLATMSHELRTPVNGMLGTSELLLDGKLDPSQSELAEIIHTSADTLLTLLNDVLDLSKLEADQVTLEALPVDLRVLIRDVVAVVRSGGDKPGVKIFAEVDDRVPGWVVGDPTRIRQILLNIVSNAMKFTEEGSVGVRARVDDERLLLEVTDTGIGMSTEVQAKIFDPFTQAEASTTRRFGGTGLGLSICRRLAEAMGGTISVRSREGQGSTFIVELPMEVAAPGDSSTDIEAANGTQSYGGLRVLVADDNPVNLRVAEKMFQRLGIDVDVAENGELAVEKAQAKGYDVVFMDMQMPVMDGLEATRILLERLLDPPPIVAFTANAFGEDQARCRDAGMVDFLSKPVRRRALEEVLQRVTSPRSRDS